MTDEELDLLVGQASPISDAQVATLDLGSGELDLLEAIMPTTLQASAPAPTLIRSARSRRRPLVIATAALGAAAASIIGIVAVGYGGKGADTAYAAELVAVAQANDRLLIRGWTVTRADEFTVDEGEMTFTDGSHELELRWGPAADFASFLADRSHPGDTDQLGGVTVLGRPGHLFHYPNSQDYTTLVEPDGPHYLELRGDAGNESAYRAVLDQLHTVGVDTWLGALPASVVKPIDRAAAIDQMLVGLPLPAGFDRSALGASSSVSDRYQLGAKVAGSVACAWFDQWFTATAARDTPPATAAAALAGHPLETGPFTLTGQSVAGNLGCPTLTGSGSGTAPTPTVP